MPKTNWKHIAGNAGISFFTTLVGVEAVLRGENPLKEFVIALIPAIVSAGLTFCKQLTEDDGVTSTKSVKSAKSKLNSLLQNITVL